MAILVLFSAAVGAFCAFDVHQLCHGMFPPEAGMPRADSCRQLDTWRSSLTLIVVPTALTAVAGVVLRRRPRLALAVTAAIAGGLLVGMAVLAHQDARFPAP
ncbi:MAG TPA: hypothetical protein VNT55_04970 [Baekduia sp.]|nr:hypothetical protein [Baekduia sp.]